MIRLLKAVAVGALIVVGAPLLIIWKIAEGLAFFAFGILSLGAILYVIVWLAAH
jgi:hypothetical protein